jgi:hypothetical protein
MTNRNLNGNWIDTPSRQYIYDLKEDAPHPIKYLLWNPQKKKDLYYLITHKIEEPHLRRSLVKYHQAIKGTVNIEWENEHVKVILPPRYKEDSSTSSQTAGFQPNNNDEPPAEGTPAPKRQQ